MIFSEYLSLLLERNFDIHNTVKKVPTTLQKQLELCLGGTHIYKDPKCWFYSFVNIPTLQTNFTKYTSNNPFGTPLGIFCYPVVYTENAIHLKTWPFAAKTKYCAMFKLSEEAYNKTYNAEGNEYKQLDETVYNEKVFGNKNSIFSIIKNKYAKKIAKQNTEYNYDDIQQIFQNVSKIINEKWGEIFYKKLLDKFNTKTTYSGSDIQKKLFDVFYDDEKIYDQITKKKYVKNILKSKEEYNYNKIQKVLEYIIVIAKNINKKFSELLINLLSDIQQNKTYSYNELYVQLVEELHTIINTIKEQGITFTETEILDEFVKTTDKLQKNKATDKEIKNFIKEQEKTVEQKLEKLHLDDNYLSKFYILVYHLFYYDTTAQKDSFGVERGKKCINLNDSTSHNEALISKIFMDCDVFGIVDNGDGLIHPNEKCQAVFLEMNKIDEKTKNKYIEKVIIWENDLFNKKYKEDYNDSDLEESRYVYDQIKKLYGSKITNFSFVKNSKNMQLPWNDDYLDNSGIYAGELEQDKEKNDDDNKQIKYIKFNPKYFVTDESIKYLQFDSITATDITFIGCKFIQKDKLSFTNCILKNCEIDSNTSGLKGEFKGCTFINSEIKSQENEYICDDCKFYGTLKNKYFNKEYASSPIANIEKGSFNKCYFSNPYKMLVKDYIKYTDCTVVRYKLLCIELNLSHSFTKDFLHKKLDFINNFKFTNKVRLKFVFDKNKIVFLDLPSYNRKIRKKLYSEEFYNLLYLNQKNTRKLTNLLTEFIK